MFSNKISTLPSCVDYYGALRIYERMPTPRSKKWDPGDRPLADTRDTHYAVIKDGDKVVFRLHRTNVVEWHGPTSLTLDSSYDSISTRSFADRFLPAGISFISMKGEGYCINNHDNKFLRGRHNFQLQEGKWHVASATQKPRRTVLDKDQAALVNEKLKDFFEWIRSMWAVSGNDGSHPWVGQPALIPRGATRYPLDSIARENYPALVSDFIPRKSIWMKGVGTTYALAPTEAEVVVTEVRQHFYTQEKCYIKIDYDAPVPKRTPAKKEKK